MESITTVITIESFGYRCDTVIFKMKRNLNNHKVRKVGTKLTKPETLQQFLCDLCGFFFEIFVVKGFRFLIITIQL
jgi:hypothetical protein